MVVSNHQSSTCRLLTPFVEAPRKCEGPKLHNKDCCPDAILASVNRKACQSHFPIFGRATVSSMASNDKLKSLIASLCSKTMASIFLSPSATTHRSHRGLPLLITLEDMKGQRRRVSSMASTPHSDHLSKTTAPSARHAGNTESDAA